MGYVLLVALLQMMVLAPAVLLMRREDARRDRVLMGEGLEDAAVWDRLRAEFVVHGCFAAQCVAVVKLLTLEEV